MTIESDRSKDGTSLNQGDVEERIVPLCDPPILFSLPSLNSNSQHDGSDVAEGEKSQNGSVAKSPSDGRGRQSHSKTNKIVSSTESNLRWGVESVPGRYRPASEPVELNHTGPVSDSAIVRSVQRSPHFRKQTMRKGEIQTRARLRSAV